MQDHHSFGDFCWSSIRPPPPLSPLVHRLSWALARGEEALNERVHGLVIDDAFGHQTGLGFRVLGLEV